METLTYRGALTVVTCWCGIRHGVPDELRRAQQTQHNWGKQMSIFCPLGHEHVISGESEATRLKRELESERNRTAAERAKHDQTKAELKSVERQKSAVKGQLTKTKNRIAAGVCPCCNRTFQNLARHIQGQHPEFAESTQ